MHDQTLLVEDMFKNNVNRTEGLYSLKPGQERLERTSPSLPENIRRWELQLKNGEFDNLRRSIDSYIDLIVGIHTANFNSICELHQRITQIYYSYLYDNSIELGDIFTKEYTYNDFLDAYQNVESLRQAVQFMTDRLSSLDQDESGIDDIKKAKAFILNNLSRDLTVREVANHVHRSPEYFTKVFKKETGQNVKSYILQVKLDVAKDMLANPNIPISMIATEIGYSNFSHFTQMFRKYTEMTPSDYRKEMLDSRQ